MIKMRRAVELKPIDALVIEFGRMLLDEEAYTEYLALYDTLAPRRESAWPCACL